MERLTTQQEDNQINKSINNQNIKNFQKILKYFFLDEDSHKRVLLSLNKETRTEEEQFLDSYFGLNEDRRAFYKIQETENSDKGFNIYRDLIYKHLIHTRDDENYYVGELNLLSYDVYRTGFITIKNQQQKLFKFLLKQGLSPLAVEKITTIKTKGDVFLCISRNPIDYLFASTNQSYTSCMDLNSSYDGAFYMGTCGAMLDPNRFLIFTTSGRPARYLLQKEEFYHFRYTTRSWGLVLNTPSLNKGAPSITFVRWYPNDNYNLADLMATAQYPVMPLNNVLDSLIEVTSLFSFTLPKFRNGTPCHTYCDYYGFYFEDHNTYKIKYTNKNPEISGSIIRGFRHTSGFNNIRTFKDLARDYPHYCSFCEVGLTTLTRYRWRGNTYCPECLNTYTITCTHCRQRYERPDHMPYGERRQMYLCPSCLRLHYKKCVGCDTLINKSDQIIIYKWGDFKRKKYPYCSTCLDDILTQNNRLKKIKRPLRLVSKTYGIFDFIDGVFTNITYTSYNKHFIKKHSQPTLPVNTPIMSVMPD